MASGRRRNRREAPPARTAYSATAGLHFDDEAFEARLVWIWTSARSGSTWFLRMLAHPLKLVDSSRDPSDLLGFTAPPAWRGNVDAIPVDTTFIANHLLPRAGSTHYLDDGTPVTFASALGLSQRGNYFFSDKYEDAWRPELRRMMLVRFHRITERVAESHRCVDPVVLLKEVAGAHAAPLVMSMFPRSKMIFLVRDGRDVVDSQTAANRPGAWLPVSGWKTAEERLDFVRQRARDWVGDVTSIEKAYEAHSPDLRRMLRYEDLLEDAGGSIGPLIEWLGLSRDPTRLMRSIEVNAFSVIPAEQKGRDRFFRSASPGAWRQNLTPAEVGALELTMSSKLRELGYETSEADASAGADVSFASPAVARSEESTSAESDESEVPVQPAADVLTEVMRNASVGRDFSGLGGLVRQRGTRASRAARQVALTFDDGPVMQTYDVAEILERSGARGTFFFVGRKLAGHERLVGRLLRAGHEVGNHSFGHEPHPSGEDLETNSLVLEHAGMPRPRLYRPPFGAVDRPTAEAIVQAGGEVVLWNADSEDAIPPWEGISAEQVTANVMRRVGPASIVLLHDGLAWSRAARALPTLIERLLEDGYELVTVSRLIGSAKPDSRPTGAPGAAGEGDSSGDAAPDLGDMLRWLAEGVEVPTGEEPWEELARAACLALDSGSIGGSGLLSLAVAALENNVVRIVGLGFALRTVQSGRDVNGARQLSDEIALQLRSAEDPGAEATHLARRYASPDRVMRLFRARITEQQTGNGETVDPDSFGAGDEFLALIGTDPELWARVQDWARSALREAAELRMRALLDAAGASGFKTSEVIQRLDVDYFLRFGYMLALCEETLTPAMR